MPFLASPPLPNLRVEIAFDSGFATPEGDRTWTDISAYVEGASSVDITYGRADELSTPDPNQCSLTLDNRDGRFTPAKASSPYFPNVKKGKPLRVTVTYGGADYVRFTGYVNAWPLVWPDGTSAASTVTVTATSRRARLGQTAPLTSAIRAAYLATSPQAYWPMDEDADVLSRGGQQVFRDITNDDVPGRAKELIASFYTTDALKPVVRDGTAGPTDEESLVKMPRFTDSGLIGAWPHYIGAGTAVRVNTTGGYVTIEMVARIAPRASGDQTIVTLATLFTYAADQVIGITAQDKRGLGFGAIVAATDVISDPVTGALLESGVAGIDVFDDAADGQIHHYAFVLDVAGTVGRIYFDGALLGSMAITHAITSPMVNVSFGTDTYNADVWIGHGAVHNRALTTAEVLAHAQAATAASETVEERVVRVAGRVGVPAAEVDVETSIAGSVGPQPEAGQSASSVLDDLATSTGGVLYDTRAGHLAMQARNHRYNLASAFTLSATLQEVQGDLAITDDHRYTINTVEFSRSGSDDVPDTIVDQDSVDDYGVFSQTYTVISESSTEVESFAQNILTRYADPDPRVSTVSVDLVNLGDSQRAAVLAADIGTRFGISALAPQSPTDPMYLFFEGATESITATSHTLTANTTPADTGQNVFILDDPAYGVLDSNVLAY